MLSVAALALSHMFGIMSAGTRAIHNSAAFANNASTALAQPGTCPPLGLNGHKFQDKCAEVARFGHDDLGRDYVQLGPSHPLCTFHPYWVTEETPEHVAGGCQHTFVFQRDHYTIYNNQLVLSVAPDPDPCPNSILTQMIRDDGQNDWRCKFNIDVADHTHQVARNTTANKSGPESTKANQTTVPKSTKTKNKRVTFFDQYVKFSVRVTPSNLPLATSPYAYFIQCGNAVELFDTKAGALLKYLDIAEMCDADGIFSCTLLKRDPARSLFEQEVVVAFSVGACEEVKQKSLQSDLIVHAKKSDLITDAIHPLQHEFITRAVSFTVRVTRSEA